MGLTPWAALAEENKDPQIPITVPAAQLEAVLLKGSMGARVRELPLRVAVPLLVAGESVKELLSVYPDAPPELVDSIFQTVLPQKGALKEARAQALAIPEATLADKGDDLFSRVRDQLRKTLDSVLDAGEDVPGGPILVRPIRDAVRLFDGYLTGRGCDSPDAVGCTTDDRIGVLSDKLGEYAADLKVGMRLSKQEVINTINKHFDEQLRVGFTTSTDQLLDAAKGISEEMKGEIRRGLSPLGDLKTSVADLKELTVTEFAGIRTNINFLMESNGQILSLLTNQAQVEAEMKRREAERQDRQQAVVLLSTLISFADPEAGRQVAVVGQNMFKISEALQGIVKLGKDGRLLSFTTAAATGDVVGAVVNIVSSLFGGGSGPTPEQMILDEIGNLKKMVRELGEQMSTRFDLIDEHLNDIYKEFSARFDRIDFRFGVLADDVIALQSSLVDIRNAIARVDARMQLLFQTQEARRYADLRLRLENYEQGALLDITNAFPELTAQFYRIAVFDSVDEISAPLTNRPASDASLAEQLGPNFDLLTGNLRFINALIKSRGWMGATSLALEPVPAAPEWLFGAEGLARAHTRWPLLGRSPVHLARLDAAVHSGEVLENALKRISLIPDSSGWKTNTLWAALLSNYRAKASLFAEERARFERSFEQETIALEHPERTAALDDFDLWLPLDRALPYTPDALRDSIKSANPAVKETISGIRDAADLLSPLNVPIGIADLLKALSITADYRDISTEPHSSVIYDSWDTYHLAWFEDSKQQKVTPRADPGWNDPNVAYIVWKRAYQEKYAARFRITLRLYSDGQPVADFRFSDPRVFSHSIRTGERLYRVKRSKFLPDDPDAFFDRNLYSIDPTRGDVEFPKTGSKTILQVLWNGGENPVDGRVILSARDRFSTGAVMTPLIAGSDAAALANRVKDKLRSLQGQYYEKLAAELNNSAGNSSAGLGRATSELQGAWELLHTLVRLGLPSSYERNDSLRGLFSGTHRLADVETLLNLTRAGLADAATTEAHTNRIDYLSVIQDSASELERTLERILADMQTTGQAEMLPRVQSQLAELKRVQAFQRNPLPPILLLASGPAPSVQVYGDDYVPYGLEQSFNVDGWSNTPTILTNGAKIKLVTGSAQAAFFRIREQP